MSTEAQKRAAKKYDDNNTVMVSVKLNKKTDADIIKYLERVDNRQAYIKAAIRAYKAGVALIDTLD